MPPAEKPADGGKRTVLHGGICALSGAGEDDGRCSCQITDSYYPLRGDYERLSHGVYALELCVARRCSPRRRTSGCFCCCSARWRISCYDTVAPRRVTAVFLMGMTSLLGFRPQVGRCAQCGTPIALDGRADDDHAAYFGAEAGGVLCEDCGAGGGVRLTAGEVRYLQAIMRCGLEHAFGRRATVRMTLFEALRQMAQERLGVTDSLGEALGVGGGLRAFEPPNPQQEPMSEYH